MLAEFLTFGSAKLLHIAFNPSQHFLTRFVGLWEATRGTIIPGTKIG